MAESPMLAGRESVHEWREKLSFPLYATPKLDGIRCIIRGGTALSRKLIPIVNNHIRALLSDPALDGIDGELVVGPVAAEDVFNKTTGAVMGNRVKEPDFTYHVFDDFTDPAMPYDERQVRLCERMLDAATSARYPFLRYVQNFRFETWEELENYEDSMLALGYEGVITRAATGLYKFGRSTKREQGMLKLKRFTDGEAEVIDFLELMRNENPDIKDALGHAKRSKAQAGLVPGGTLGKLVCRDLATGTEFQIGMFKGLTAEQKQEIWDNREGYRGFTVKYQHLAHGAIDRPRHSKFLGWRDARDMS